MAYVVEARACDGLSPDDFLQYLARCYQSYESISEGDGYKIWKLVEKPGPPAKDRLFIYTDYEPFIEAESGDMIYVYLTKGNEPEESDQYVIA